MNETLEIDTPENVVFGYSVAGIGSRFLAALVDSLAIVIMEAMAYLLLLLIMVRKMQGSWPSWLIGIVGMVAFLLMYGYYIFFEVAWNGQSLGKRWVGLRVIRMDGMPISLAESLIRNIIRLIDFMPVFYGVGLITMFINSQARRLGDLAAGTLVVIDRGTISLPAMPEVPRAAYRVQTGENAPSAELPINLLSNQDVQLVQEFFNRQSNLVSTEALSTQILAGLYKKMNLTDRSVDPATANTALAEILAAVRRASEEKNKL